MTQKIVLLTVAVHGKHILERERERGGEGGGKKRGGEERREGKEGGQRGEERGREKNLYMYVCTYVFSSTICKAVFHAATLASCILPVRKCIKRGKCVYIHWWSV